MPGGAPRHRPIGKPDLGLLKIYDQLNEVLKAEAVLLRRTDNIEKQCKSILITVVKIQESIDNLDLEEYLSPDLESAVKLVERIAVTIDDKVPD